MKTVLLRALALVGLAFGYAIAGCATTRAVAVDCGVEVAPQLVTAVGLALGGDDYEAQLRALVTQYGLCVVRNAVETFVLTAPKTLGVDVRVSRGRAWLVAHPLPASAVRRPGAARAYASAGGAGARPRWA